MGEVDPQDVLTGGSKSRRWRNFLEYLGLVACAAALFAALTWVSGR